MESGDWLQKQKNENMTETMHEKFEDQEMIMQRQSTQKQELIDNLDIKKSVNVKTQNKTKEADKPKNILSDEKLKKRMKSARKKHDSYFRKHSNIFNTEYAVAHGGTSYMKIAYLKDLNSGKGTKEEKIAKIDAEKAKSHKNLYASDEGIFDNESTRNHIEHMKDLNKFCMDLVDLDYATPSFIEAVNGVKAYITASTYEEQQKELFRALSGLSIFTKEHKKKADKELNGVYAEEIRKVFELREKIYGMTRGNLAIDKNKKLKVSADPRCGLSSYYVSVEKQILFPHDPCLADVKQRTTSDCYMMSSLAEIALKCPQKIKNAMRDNVDTVTVRFYDEENRPVYITVKKSIPKYLGKVQTNAVDCLWVQMIEKAFAVYYGNSRVQTEARFQKKNKKGEPVADNGVRSYSALSYKDSYVFLSRFLGNQYINREGSTTQIYNTAFEDEKLEKIYISRETNEEDRQVKHIKNDSKSLVYSGWAKRLFDDFDRRLNGPSKEIITVGINGEYLTSAERKQMNNKGFRVNHAYAVLNVYSKEVSVKGEKKIKRFVRLRDPYGSYTAGYDENGNTISTGKSGIAIKSTSTMGTFDMEWNDFINTYDSYSGCMKDNIGANGNEEQLKFMQNPFADEELKAEMKKAHDERKKAKGGKEQTAEEKAKGKQDVKDLGFDDIDYEDFENEMSGKAVQKQKTEQPAQEAPVEDKKTGEKKEKTTQEVPAEDKKTEEKKEAPADDDEYEEVEIQDFQVQSAENMQFNAKNPADDGYHGEVKLGDKQKEV